MSWSIVNDPSAPDLAWSIISIPSCWPSLLRATVAPACGLPVVLLMTVPVTAADAEAAKRDRTARDVTAPLRSRLGLRLRTEPGPKGAPLGSGPATGEPGQLIEPPSLAYRIRRRISTPWGTWRRRRDIQNLSECRLPWPPPEPQAARPWQASACRLPPGRGPTRSEER